jgi:hypothetical protein
MVELCVYRTGLVPREMHHGSLRIYLDDIGLDHSAFQRGSLLGRTTRCNTRTKRRLNASHSVVHLAPENGTNYSYMEKS